MFISDKKKQKKYGVTLLKSDQINLKNNNKKNFKVIASDFTMIKESFNQEDVIILNLNAFKKISNIKMFKI